MCVAGVHGWPEGTYGLPMATSGCPASQDFDRTQNTEDESKASDSIHLAGVSSDLSDSIVQNFCMKTSYTQDGDYVFTKGQYCLFKKGECPAGFKEGWIYWDDDSSFIWEDEIQNHSGTLPDGEYDSNTKIFYCCRNDGPVSKALRLPKEAPFFLFKVGEECMHVSCMEASEEWVYWSDESTLNLNGRGGLHPDVQRSRYPWRYTKLFYCYYTLRGGKNILWMHFCLNL
ncbi:hypothetical protein CAPTEDRAFT_180131 [Capitella teleta]|uniref:Apextrin C-terminal domain-containing protein n=1 Tax=Capitella teleta TaxID=283909 RepID=N1PB95_CAPTE|nr:hypothetical protein CAPTEDRAFT_180131 [Capitella teleta]|eukprot:ELU18815.1 hypothetical protein CAPTEDRAFT_180131 [Capitella teleta]